MNCHEMKKYLQDYVDEALTPGRAHAVTQHLESCNACRAEVESLRSLIADLHVLPRATSPARDLWPEIEARLPQLETASARGQNRFVEMINDVAGKLGAFFRPRTLWVWRGALAAAFILLVYVGSLLYVHTVPGAWEVASLEGMPKIGAKVLTGKGLLAMGDWLETDAGSRAQINVGVIGAVEVEPNTRIQLLKAQWTEHRLALEVGTMHAKIWAPPRFFFVNTPSAQAIDLGCAYTLTVDSSGAGFLHVTSGWVAFEREGRESVVPAGARCETRPVIGPGTPYFEDAPDALTAALPRFDFENGGEEALQTILTFARQRDTLTLWNLLARANEAQRVLVYERMVELVPLPANVTRAGVLQLDRKMLERWKDKLEVYWVE